MPRREQRTARIPCVVAHIGDTIAERIRNGCIGQLEREEQPFEIIRSQSREMVKLIGVNKQGLPGLQSEHALIDMNLSDGFQIEGQHESVMRSILQRLLLQAFTLPADEHKHVG